MIRATNVTTDLLPMKTAVDLRSNTIAMKLPSPHIPSLFAHYLLTKSSNSDGMCGDGIFMAIVLDHRLKFPSAKAGLTVILPYFSFVLVMLKRPFCYHYVV